MISREFILGAIKRSYGIACEHGFHDVEISDVHCMMLVLSEIGEMVEADRKRRRARYDAIEHCEKHPEDVDTRSRMRYFERDVKDTLEDELADVVIRIFDFCGLRGYVPLMSNEGLIDMDDEFKEIFGAMSVCEQCFSLSCLVTDVGRHSETWSKTRIEKELGSILSFCFDFAKFHGFDLQWHVEHKMEYNESRPRKHGKKY